MCEVTGAQNLGSRLPFSIQINKPEVSVCNMILTVFIKCIGKASTVLNQIKMLRRYYTIKKLSNKPQNVGFGLVLMVFSRL